MQRQLRLDRTRTIFHRLAGHQDEGQVSIMVVLAVGTFLIAFVGFGVDMTNLFLHRQTAQGAADAACVAAGMDMEKQRVNGRCTSAAGTSYPCGNFTSGTTFNCATAGSPTPAPCAYAALNGYNGANGTIPLPQGVEGNSVQVSFPASVSGAVTPDATLTGPYPFVQVDVYDAVKVYFSSWLSGSRTQSVHALAKCGLQVVNQPVPILVLDPTEAKSFQVNGNPLVQIIGGPNRSIQVNSEAFSAQASGDAAYLSASTNQVQVDLTHAGLNYDGANFGVTGGPDTAPGGFLTSSPFSWQSHVSPVDDPFALVPPPADPGVKGTTTPIAYGTDGCPDPAATVANGKCIEFTAGYYDTGISVQNYTAIFDPGVYYIKGGTFQIQANSLVRPGTAAGDGSMGTIFYLTCATPGSCTSKNVATVLVGANAGGNTADAFDTSRAHCPGDTAWDSRAGIPATVGGNVFLAPCTKDGTYPQAPQGLGIGAQRGILFFADRSAAAQGGQTFNGGGGLLLTGTMYFRDCPNLLTTGTCQDPPTDYQNMLYLTGGSGSGTRVFGQIVTDQLTLQGNSGITMDLNPWSKPVLKVALLQ
jgi:putative Flp pilus-assembly TadE/G-like protein